MTTMLKKNMLCMFLQCLPVFQVVGANADFAKINFNMLFLLYNNTGYWHYEDNDCLYFR